MNLQVLPLQTKCNNPPTCYQMVEDCHVAALLTYECITRKLSGAVSTIVLPERIGNPGATVQMPRQYKQVI